VSTVQKVVCGANLFGEKWYAPIVVIMAVTGMTVRVIGRPLSLRGLWLGKVYGFLLETEGKSDEESSQFVKREAEAFEDLKPFLLSNCPRDD